MDQIRHSILELVTQEKTTWHKRARHRTCGSAASV